MFGLLPRGTSYVIALVIVAFLGVKYVPVYVNAYQFNDAVRQVLKFSGTRGRSPQVMKTSIMAEASEFGIPVTSDSVKVTRDGVILTVEISYKVPIDLQFYQHELSFDSRHTSETFAR